MAFMGIDSNNFEIFYPVVVFYSVFMMNIFLLCQWAAKVLFHNIAMFFKISSINSNSNIARLFIKDTSTSPGRVIITHAFSSMTSAHFGSRFFGPFTAFINTERAFLNFIFLKMGWANFLHLTAITNPKALSRAVFSNVFLIGFNIKACLTNYATNLWHEKAPFFGFNCNIRLILCQLLIALIFIPNASATPPSRQNVYLTGTVIASASVSENEDVIYSYLNSGVDTYAPLSIANAAISTTANIQSDKLNLTSIAQNVLITASGSLEVDGTSTFDGAVTFNGTTFNIGNGGVDTLTINTPGGITFTPAATWTFTGAQTVSGTWADLGTVTTADINGGTIDGTTIGASSRAPGSFTEFTASTAGAGRILVSDGNNFNSVVISGDATIDAAGVMDVSGGAQTLEESAAFTAVTTFTISETIGAGDVYQIIVEGSTNADGNSIFTPALRINGDTSGNNYFTMLTGIVGTGGANPTNVFYESNTNNIDLSEVSTFTFEQSQPFRYTFTITARGGDTQVEWVGTHSKAIMSASSRSEGFGLYDAGTPTSITFFSISGTTTMTGHYYVLKYSQ